MPGYRLVRSSRMTEEEILGYLQSAQEIIEDREPPVVAAANVIDPIQLHRTGSASTETLSVSTVDQDDLSSAADPTDTAQDDFISIASMETSLVTSDEEDPNIDIGNEPPMPAEDEIQSGISISSRASLRLRR